MAKAYLTQIQGWYTRLNDVRTYVGLSTVSPYETLSAPLKMKSVQMTTLRDQITSTQTQYNLTGTLAWDTSAGIAAGTKIRQSLITALENTLTSLESVNVAGASYSQTSNNNGTNTYGTNSNGSLTNGTKTNGTYSNVTQTNGWNTFLSKTNTQKQNGTNSNYPCSYGSNTNGTDSNGTQSNTTMTNGCTQTTYTKETTYTNT